MCVGAVLIATFGAIEEPAHSLNQLLRLLQRRAFILWMVGTAAFALVILLGSRLLRSYYYHSLHRSKSATGLRGPNHPRQHPSMLQSRLKLVRGLSYGLVSGILSAHSLLLAKSAVELLVRTVIDRANQFNRWQSWAILMSMITLALTQMFYLHNGLKLCSTSVLYPFVFCIYNIIAILDGLIYFRQVSQLAGSDAGLIAVGTVVLLSGVLCLSWRLEDTESHSGMIGGGVGSSQTALSSSVGYMPGSSDTVYTPLDVDEESQTGEREPLLHAIRTRRQRRTTPSLGLASSMKKHHHRASTSDVNPASIWAELDDSDYESNDGFAGQSSKPTKQSRSKSGNIPTALHGGQYHSPKRHGFSHTESDLLSSVRRGGPSRTRSLLGYQQNWNNDNDNNNNNNNGNDGSSSSSSSYGDIGSIVLDKRRSQNSRTGSREPGWSLSRLFKNDTGAGSGGRSSASVGYGYGSISNNADADEQRRPSGTGPEDDGDGDGDQTETSESWGNSRPGELARSRTRTRSRLGQGSGHSRIRAIWQTGQEYVQRWMG